MDDFTVTNVATGDAVTPAGLQYDAATNTATLLFDGVLPDGDYRAVLDSAGITDAAGNTLVPYSDIEFFQFAGDVNRDRKVDTTDYIALASTFGRRTGEGEPLLAADLNGDGAVDSSDFTTLAGNFGHGLDTPTGGTARQA
jgi:hypothetical protein